MKQKQNGIYFTVTDREKRRISKNANLCGLKHFLRDHNVECTEDFLVCRSEIKEQIKNYEAERQHIRNQIRRAKTPKEDYSHKEKSREITKKLTPLRKQLKICERIENKVPLLRALIEQEKQLEQGRYKYKYYHQNKSRKRSYER